MKTYKLSSIKKILDGDTIDAIIDLGFNVMVLKRIRLYGMDAPETRTSNKEMKIYGNIAKEQLLTWCSKAMMDDKDEIYMEIKASDTNDKYGRILGELIFHEGENTTNINQWMIQNQYAIPFDGTTNKAERTKLHEANWKYYFLV